jgi:hypothetical protein
MDPLVAVIDLMLLELQTRPHAIPRSDVEDMLLDLRNEIVRTKELVAA